MIEEVIAIIFGALLILEGVLIAIIPKQSLRIVKKLLKKQNKLRAIGITEAIIGIIILLTVLLTS